MNTVRVRELFKREAAAFEAAISRRPSGTQASRNDDRGRRTSVEFP
jgi:hypothetical protein